MPPLERQGAARRATPRRSRTGPIGGHVVGGPRRRPVDPVPGDEGVHELRGGARTWSGPRPSRSSAAGRTLVTKTSAVARSRSATSRPRSSDRSRAMLRFPRLSSSNTGLTSRSPPSMRWKVRGSPPGGSIFTTSAPQSARMPAAPGPATQTPSSTTHPLERTGPGLRRQRRPPSNLRTGLALSARPVLQMGKRWHQLAPSDSRWPRMSG